MIRHLLKLAWNRKRSNALIVLEIAVTFLVVFGVVTVGLQFARNALSPLGYRIDDVWTVRIEGRTEDKFDAADAKTYESLLREVRGTDGVVSAAGASLVPYDPGGDAGNWDHDGGTVNVEFAEVSDDYKDVLDLDVTRGRWFAESDATLPYRPVVIDEDMSRAWFGAEDPVGKTLPLYENSPEARVVGVVEDFRKDGELSGRGNFLFVRAHLGEEGRRRLRNLVLRVEPGLDARFEEALVARLQQIAPEWTFELLRLSQMRETSFRLRLAPLVAAGIVGVFLLLMASLGLLGVLWQNVTRRTREIGLRRATGASRREIGTQMMQEVFLTASLGLLLGGVVVAQAPLLDLLGFVEGKTFVLGLLASAAAIYVVALACGVYPGILAARVRPAEALHQE